MCPCCACDMDFAELESACSSVPELTPGHGRPSLSHWSRLLYMLNPVIDAVLCTSDMHHALHSLAKTVTSSVLDTTADADSKMHA